MNLAMIILILLARLSGGAHAQRKVDLGDGTFYYQLPVQQDVTLERGSKNFDGLEHLLTGLHKGYPIKRSLVQFQDLPSNIGCEILGARMYLHFHYAHKPSFYTIDECPYLEQKVEVYIVSKSWDETKATSTYRRSGSKWSEAYLALDGRDAYPDVIDSVVMYPGYPGGNWVEFEVTEAVKQWWESGTYANHGLLIKSKDEDTDARDRRFYSKSHGDSSKHPYINVLCREMVPVPVTLSPRPTPIDNPCLRRRIEDVVDDTHCP